jgi:hypothetical protein
MSPDQIAEFQSLLLEILDSQQDLTEIRSSLDALMLDRELVEYIDTFDPVMVEVAASLVKKWGLKSE